LRRLRAALARMLGRPVGATFAPAAGSRVEIDGARIDLPAGWAFKERSGARVVLRSASGHQQATFSVLRLGGTTPPPDFERLCEQRLEAERHLGARRTFFERETSALSDGRPTFLYRGGDRATGRLFSGYLSLSGQRLFTVYVEGAGAATDEHLAAFDALVKSFRPAPLQA
jgi:hypothetical protein